MLMVPHLSNCRGPISSFCTLEGGGPKYVRGMSAPMDGGDVAMSSSCCCVCCENDYVAELSADVITSTMVAIPNKDALRFIAPDLRVNAKKTISRLFPILIQKLVHFLPLVDS